MEAISVSRFNTYIKQIFDSEELLHNISIVGEVFDVSLSRNVIYFSLKDENASLPCVCFYPNFINNIKEGEKIIVVGSPNFYVKGGKLNFNVVKVEKVGLGKLYEEFLAMKKKLEEEGLFDKEHKKEMPKVIKRIGVITSKEGAVIQDIKNVAWRRNKNVDIVLFNTKVQGNNAEQEIAHAIDLMGQYDGIDVIIVARGGGSLEDLWAYNTEVVARATFNCTKPIVSAVGHETDWTIIDFVSDLRAPTPSASAELLTVNIQDKKHEFIEKYNTFVHKVQSYLDKKQFEINSQDNKLVAKIDDNLKQKYYELGLMQTTLKKIDPREILKNGYARVEQNQKLVKSINDVKDDDIKVFLKDGNIIAKVTKKEKRNENN